jgi:hypothetical protein
MWKVFLKKKTSVLKRGDNKNMCISIVFSPPEYAFLQKYYKKKKEKTSTKKYNCPLLFGYHISIFLRRKSESVYFAPSRKITGSCPVPFIRQRFHT